MSDVAVEVPFRTVKPLAGLAAREHVAVQDAKGGDVWFAVMDGRDVLAFGALHRGYRIKATWTNPAFRGMGLGTLVARAIIERAEPGRMVEVISLQPAWWLRMGWVEHGKHQFGGLILRCPREQALKALAAQGNS